MKVFVWRHVLEVWHEGIAIGIANNVNEARENILKYLDCEPWIVSNPECKEEIKEQLETELKGPYEEYELPFGLSMMGDNG